MVENKDKIVIEKIKKVWVKPKLISAKEIGFFGLGNVTTGTGFDPTGS